MKIYTVNKISKLIFLLGLSVLMIVPVACKKMEDLNVDKKALPYGPYVPAALLASMENSIIKINPEWQYQLQQNLNADIYSGYMMSPTPFNGNNNNTNYFMMDGWNGFVSSIAFNEIMNPWIDIKKATEKNDPDLYSISLIIKVLGMHRLTDVFGPLPYTHYGEGTNVEFDSQETIYNAFFTELKSAVDNLTGIEDNDPAFDARFARYDISSFAGDYKKWIQLANTLRLRLAIRISKVSPAKAQAEAEAAVNHKYGVLTSGTSFQINQTFKHPLATISGSWNDILMGAPLECIMGGYDDPRLPKYVLPASDTSVSGQYKGIREGIDITTKSTYVGFSLLNFKTTDPILLISASESYFLRAEGTLRGWNMGSGTVKDFYENGVKASFDQYGLFGADNYLISMKTPKPYVDPKNPANNVGGSDINLSKITVRWDDTAPFETKLERVITQKWIAIYPDGEEAWAEFRRTGYPKLFPVVINNSQGKIPNGEFIKRLPYPSSMSTTSPTAVSNAVTKYLGGNDGPNTKLWWNL
jgi:hypothetical protein